MLRKSDKDTLRFQAATPIARRSILQAALAGGGVAALGGVTNAFGREIEGERGAAPALAPMALKTPDLKRDIPGFGNVDHSSIVVYDIDGDGKGEIIGGTSRYNDQSGKRVPNRKGGIYVMKPDGTIMQLIETANNTPVNSSPAIGRLFGPTGDLYLVVGIGADVDDIRHDAGIQAFRFDPVRKQFEPAFTYYLRDDGPPPGPDGYRDAVWSTPCLVDVDNDGVLEVFFGGWDRYIYLIKPTPQGFVTVFEYSAWDTIWSSGAAADVNGDGYPELIIGQDISPDPNFPVTTDNRAGGYLVCFDRTGKRLWRNYYPETIYSSPLIADIDGDGKLEVVVGSGEYWGRFGRPGIDIFTPYPGNFVVCCDAATGAEKWRFTTNGHGWMSPALGDFLGKKNPVTGLPTYQIVAGTMRYENQNSTLNESELYLIDSNGAEVWRRRPKDYRGMTHFLKASPIVADVNGDGKVEVVVPMLWDLISFDAAGNQLEIYHTPWSVFGTPCVADADGDGKLEMYIACSNAEKDITGATQCDRGWVFGFKLPSAANAPQPWPMYRRSALRTGAMVAAQSKSALAVNLVNGKGLANVPITVSSDVGGSGFTIEVVDQGYGALGTPGASVQEIIATPNYLTVTKTASTLGQTPGTVATVAVDGSKLPNTGNYRTTIRIKPTAAGVTVSPSEIALTVVVAPRHVSLPSVLKARS